MTMYMRTERSGARETGDRNGGRMNFFSKKNQKRIIYIIAIILVLAMVVGLLSMMVK